MNFKTEKLILEGPDLTGKTSLYNEIHKKTKFQWNIQDRSALSMVCYARQFNRNTSELRRCLYKELTNLNNRVVILLPDFDIIEKRYKKRGDDFQDLNSLRKLYAIFKEEIAHIEDLPNVLVINSDATTLEILNAVLVWLRTIEKSTTSMVGSMIRSFVEEAQDNEHVVTLEYCGLPNRSYSSEILKNPLEGKYYKEIDLDFFHIIDKEQKGINEYSQKQNEDSRRFYYSSRSCISSLHFKPRGKTLEFLCTFRSTDAQKNASIDFQFLEYLVHKAASKYFLNCEKYRIMLMMNSVHLR